LKIFENKGAVMGCSNPHPHCQIWASSFVPQEPAREIEAMAHYKKENGTCMLCDYVKVELNKKIRVVLENDHFVVVVPYWALWPYEILVLAKSHIGNLSEFDDQQIHSLADALKRSTCKYDNLFETSFPYSMGIHQDPTDGMVHDCHFHMHFYPPLLRSATVKKFMVGYEMLGEPQRDLTAEFCANKLAQLSDSHHYKSK
jgi:UDPglucose--hexose-1-phosphate uridylyltransferase